MITAWILYDQYKKGSENQCLSLAQQLKISYTSHPISVKSFWRFIPRIFWTNLSWCLSENHSLDFDNVPRLIIASGHISAGIAALIKKRYGIPVIYILNPKMPAHNFDWIITPKHDQLSGKNVISILGSLSPHGANWSTSSKSFYGQSEWQHLPRPHIALLIGGSNKYYKLDKNTIQQLGSRLNSLYNEKNISLIITFSRRTTSLQRKLMAESINGIAHWIWNEEAPNPYVEMLQHADYILITGDSIAMISEACATGKPVYIIQLPGQSQKFDRFYGELITGHYANFFQGSLDDYPNQILNETERVGNLLKPWMASLSNKYRK